MPEEAQRRFEDLLEEAERRPLVGWELSYDGRIGFHPPWDFGDLVDARLGASGEVLDLGTGGGEWLSRRAIFSGRTFATEAWAPNVPVARARLEPLGVRLVAVEGAPDNIDQAAAARLPALPFANSAFHLVISRHESFVAAEVARILAVGGRFLTQQIRSDFDAPLRALLGFPIRTERPPWDLGGAFRQVRGAGLEGEASGEGEVHPAFADVGALAWYLFNVPWVLPGLGAEEWREPLRTLHGQGPLSLAQPMFWLEALKA